ncbi:MAG: GYD domain-containing protein [Calditrichaceae bacterium]
MSTYVMFGKYSADGFKGMSSNRTSEATEAINKHGGQVIEMYALLGDKDLVLILDFPNTEKAMKAAIVLSKLTGIAFTTSPAVPVAEFDKMLSDL